VSQTSKSSGFGIIPIVEVIVDGERPCLEIGRNEAAKRRIK
jgi:hypothetical protein